MNSSVVPGPAAQSFLPLREMPKHFSLASSALAAGAAASPALADDHGRWHHDDAQGDRAQTQADHQQAHEARQEARS